MAKWPVQNKHIAQHSTKHAEQQDVTDIQNKLFLCVFDLSFFSFFILDVFKTNLSPCSSCLCINQRKFELPKYIISSTQDSIRQPLPDIRDYSCTSSKF